MEEIQQKKKNIIIIFIISIFVSYIVGIILLSFYTGNLFLPDEFFIHLMVIISAIYPALLVFKIKEKTTTKKTIGLVLFILLYYILFWFLAMSIGLAIFGM